MKNVQFDIEKLRLDDIVITNASVESSEELLDATTDVLPLEAAYSFVVALNRPENKVRITLDVEISKNPADHSGITAKGRFQIDFYFYVPELDSFIETTPEDIYLDTAITTTLCNMAYSTGRGIIFTRCQGTLLKKVILPILPTAKIEALVTKPL